jgi:hypothetical protein
VTPIKVFFIEPTGMIDRRLRRYCEASCPVTGWIHNAEVPFDVVPEPVKGLPWDEPQPSHDDPRWPKTCVCGYAFTPEDERHVLGDRIYRRIDTGQEMRLRDAPIGAMWYGDWRLKYGSGIAGPDGHVLYVRCPDPNTPPLNAHDWCVDDECRNCTRKGDRTHKCWCRHGDPRTGNVHVDKVGNTCSAGAGSILTDHWHGFLHNGFLRDA